MDSKKHSEHGEKVIENNEETDNMSNDEEQEINLEIDNVSNDEDIEVEEHNLEEYDDIEDVKFEIIQTVQNDISDTSSVMSHEDLTIYTENELKKMKVPELKRIVKNKGKKGYSKLNKNELISKILQ